MINKNIPEKNIKKLLKLCPIDIKIFNFWDNKFIQVGDIKSNKAKSVVNLN